MLRIISALLAKGKQKSGAKASSANGLKVCIVKNTPGEVIQVETEAIPVLLLGILVAERL